MRIFLILVQSASLVSRETLIGVPIVVNPYWTNGGGWVQKFGYSAIAMLRRWNRDRENILVLSAFVRQLRDVHRCAHRSESMLDKWRRVMQKFSYNAIATLRRWESERRSRSGTEITEWTT